MRFCKSVYTLREKVERKNRESSSDQFLIDFVLETDGGRELSVTMIPCLFKSA